MIELLKDFPDNVAALCSKGCDKVRAGERYAQVKSEFKLRV